MVLWKQRTACIYRSAVLEDQVFDLIIGEAVITEKKMTYQEVIKPDQGQAEIEKAEDDV